MAERALRFLDRAYLKLGRVLGRDQWSRATLLARSIELPRLAPPPTGRWLVLAPHPDDETIGCGGAILRHKRRREMVECVLMTGGDYGDRPEGEHPRAEEMRAALDVLGVERLEFLDGRDRRLAFQPELVDQLRERLRRSPPNHVFLPAYSEANVDHAWTNLIFLEAATGVLDPKTPVWGYEVWRPCPANVGVDVSLVIDEKLRALRRHASQLKSLRYDEAILGLNRYRSIQVNMRLDPTMTHAEAFARLPLEAYAAVARQWLLASVAPELGQEESARATTPGIA
jgi:LmbE family N-acetylglucosaminyl deacetylase